MRRLVLAAVAALALGLAEAADGRLVIELNKLEPAAENGCQAFFLFRNHTFESLSAFELSLAVLDGDGVIDRVLSIDAAPVPAERTTLRLFEIPEIGCDQISELILHDVPACATEEDATLDCFSLIELVSRGNARFIK